MEPRHLLIRISLTLLAVAALAGGITLVRWLSLPPEDTRLTALLADAERLRDDADACAGALAVEETRFREFDREVDSLRAALREYETAGVRRTVPADQYDDYMALFERYNEAVPHWHARADSLREQWARCRGVAEEHNNVVEAAAARRYGTDRRD